MSYEILFDENVIDYLEKLDVSMRERLFNKILSSKNDPLRYFIRLKGRGDFRMRIGDYRVIADIDQDEEKIFITLIGHRRNVYHSP